MAAVLAAVKRGPPAEVAKLLQEGVDPNIPVRAQTGRHPAPPSVIFSAFRR